VSTVLNDNGQKAFPERLWTKTNNVVLHCVWVSSKCRKGCLKCGWFLRLFAPLNLQSKENL